MIVRLAVLGLMAICVSSSPLEDSWIVSHRVARQTEVTMTSPEDTTANKKAEGPLIDSMKIESQIQLRYAKTKVTSRVLNPANEAQEAIFHVVLPDTAYISGFLMRIKGQEYVADVKEKVQAQEEYNAAVDAGQTAAQVSTNNARDANQLTVSVNVAAAEKIEFELNYEELLVRRLGKYEHAIHVNPGRVVPNLHVQVNINESLPIKVNVVDLRNDITAENEEGKQVGEVQQISDTEAEINFRPTVKEQEDFSKAGIEGQFVVQYEVDYSSVEKKGGEIQVMDGYFVHFFAPSNLPVLPKHVVFVLDTSGSMAGDKLSQTKQAMAAILDQLTSQDYFSIVEFSYDAKEWDLRKATRPSFTSPWFVEISTPSENSTSTTTEATVDETYGPYDDIKVYPVNEKAISKAKQFVDSMQADGGTNINDALLLALKNVQSVYGQVGSNPAPIIVFLTDGEPTSGETTLEKILSNSAKANSDGVVSIFSLAFGQGADFNFLKKVSLQNKGFARKIYEASDAAIQLKGFFSEIASPLLSDVKFTYVGNVESVVDTAFPKYFAGGELVVAGKVKDSLTILVNATSANGTYVIETNRTQGVADSGASGFLERFWAYLTIKELIKKSEGDNNSIKNSKDRALDLSLRYKFVTKLTSLLVVKPNGSSVEELEPADANNAGKFAVSSLAFAPYPVSGLGYVGPQSVQAVAYPAPPLLAPLTSRRPVIYATSTTSVLLESGDIDKEEATVIPTESSPVIPDWLSHLPYNETHVTVTFGNSESTLLWGHNETKTYGFCLTKEGNSTVVTCKSPWECDPTYVFNVDDICVIEKEYIGICCGF